MKLLSIETATQACSASLWIDGQIETIFEMAPRKHANLILSMVDQLLQKAQIKGEELDAIALSEGPGAFTGIRVAAGVVQGLAFGWQVPVIRVSTLEALIWQAYEQTGKTQWTACLDARMNEIYVQSGEIINQILTSTPAQLVNIEEAEQKVTLQNGVGDIEVEYANITQEATQWISAMPSAEGVVKVAAQRLDEAKFVQDELPVPIYLRNNIAETTAERLRKQAK